MKTTSAVRSYDSFTPIEFPASSSGKSGTRAPVFKIRYRQATYKEGLVQLTLTLSLYAGFLVTGLYIASTSYLLSLPFAVATAAFIVRLFMIQHDCGHYSYFPSQKWNDVAGFFLGIVTITPYVCWRRFHAFHHASSGNLDKRGIGDVRMLTVRQYQQLGPLKKFAYRLYRMPLILFGLGPFVLFVLRQRLTYYIPPEWKKERVSVHWTNVCILLLIVAGVYLGGTLSQALFYVTAMAIAASIGVWLFYVQHQYEDAYWKRSQDWSFWESGMKGSSYFKLPQPLQWLTANIGFHHVHHLNSGIPNYRLEECFHSHPEVQNPPTLTLREGFQCMSLKLWDEDQGRMVKFNTAEKCQWKR